MVTVIMSLGVTFTQAHVWFCKTGQAEASTTVQQMSSWL